MDALDRRQARRPGRRAAGRCGRGGSTPAGRPDATAPTRTCRPAPTSPTDNPVPDAAVLGHPGRQGHRAGRLRRRCSTSARTFMGQWGLKPTRGGDGPVVRGARRDRGPAAAADVAGADPDREDARGGRRLRLLPVRQRGRRPGPAASDGRRPSATGSPSRASGAAGTCAWPTSSGRRSPARSTWSASSWSRWARGSREVDRASCSPADAYRDYLELHGLSVQLTEALAEYWHTRMRAELGFAGEDPDEPEDYFDLALPRGALLLRLRRLPRPRGPRQDRRPARAGADRGQALRGVPAAPRAVDRRAGRCTTPRRRTSTPSERRRACADGPLPAVLFDMDGLLVDTEATWFAVETEIMAGLGAPWGAGAPGRTRGRPAGAVGAVHARPRRPPRRAAGRAGAGSCSRGWSRHLRAGPVELAARCPSGCSRRRPTRACPCALVSSSLPAGHGRGARRPSAPSTSR